MLDFVIEDLKVCIEFNGDYWHANDSNTEIEKYYSSSEDLKFLRTRIHERDFEKHEIIKNEMKFSLLVVNEFEYIKDPVEILNKCVNFIKNERN